MAEGGMTMGKARKRGESFSSMKDMAQSRKNKV